MRLPELIVTLALSTLVGCSQLHVPLGAKAENNPATRGVGTGRTQPLDREDWRAGVTPATQNGSAESLAPRRDHGDDPYSFAATDARSDKASHSRRAEARSRHRSVMKKKRARRATVAHRDHKRTNKARAASKRPAKRREARPAIRTKAPKRPAQKASVAKKAAAKKQERVAKKKPVVKQERVAKKAAAKKQERVAKKAAAKKQERVAKKEAPRKEQQDRPAKTKKSKQLASAKGDYEAIDKLPAKKVDYDDRGQAIDDEVPDALK